jgi:cellulose synthase/poly-beta-1,6-N-acetylglucosamine synthase-like glycosyltransferase
MQRQTGRINQDLIARRSEVIGGLIIALVVFNLVAQARFLILNIAMWCIPDAEATSDGQRPDLQTVALQVAAYREAPALPSVLRAIMALDWPRDRFVVQIIDDSEGEDARATREVTEQFARQGLRVDYFNRGSRAGFKAGALNYGLGATQGIELIAYFDADCRPRSDFLTRVVPRFSDPRVAGVQARWEYPNASVSPLTMAQQAAFEYLFRYEFGIRAYLGSPVYYLGSAAVWRREAIEGLGGWRFAPFTAEDVDMGYRAGNSGWKVLYEPNVVADNDAVEDILAFRAQQRRWARAVTQAGIDAARGCIAAPWGRMVQLVECTALLPHATIPLTLVTTLLIALHVIVGRAQSGLLHRMEWVFAVCVLVPPSVIAVVLATRYFHPRQWILQVALLAKAGPVAAATMTSFLFGLVDLAMARSVEFISTPKAGQVAVMGDSRRRWLGALYAPLVFDAVVALLLLTGGALAIKRGELSAAVPTALLGLAFVGSVILSVRAAFRHCTKLNGAAVKNHSESLSQV